MHVYPHYYKIFHNYTKKIPTNQIQKEILFCKYKDDNNFII